MDGPGGGQLTRASVVLSEDDTEQTELKQGLQGWRKHPAPGLLDGQPAGPGLWSPQEMGGGSARGSTGSVLRKESKAKTKHLWKVVRLVVWEGDDLDLVTSGKCGCLWDIPGLPTRGWRNAAEAQDECLS